MAKKDTSLDGIAQSITELGDMMASKISKVETSLEAKIDKVETSLEAKIDKVETSLEAKIDKVEKEQIRQGALLEDAIYKFDKNIDLLTKQMNVKRRVDDHHERIGNLESRAEKHKNRREHALTAVRRPVIAMLVRQCDVCRKVI